MAETVATQTGRLATAVYAVQTERATMQEREIQQQKKPDEIFFLMVQLHIFELTAA